jgi:glycosyltransferase involved in cell wall biosynthesis
MKPRTPKVSFVVPCYNLAHLLGECVHSILEQTYTDFEVLIMDDASPDNTPEVARSFKDLRVKHIRNEVNLKHLANYNRGIGLARGDYIWLISADDKLRRPYVLEKFVAHMDLHPEVGFVFCPVMKFRDGAEFTRYGACGEEDAVFGGQDFILQHLLRGNIVPAPAGMARRRAYDLAGLFPLDMPFAGDWYMWLAFALDGDVGYFAEPMVSYRDHAFNMTKGFKERAQLLMADEMRVLSRFMGVARERRDRKLIAAVERAVAYHYGYRVIIKARNPEGIGMTALEFEESLREWCADEHVRASVRARVYAELGDYHFDAGNVEDARRSYEAALRQAPARLRTALKYLLLRSGGAGRAVRERLTAARRRHRRQA